MDKEGAETGEKTVKKASCIGNLFQFLFILTFIGGGIWFIFLADFAYGSILYNVQFIATIIWVIFFFVLAIFIFVKVLPVARREKKEAIEDFKKRRKAHPQLYGSHINKKTGDIILRSNTYTGIKGEQWIASGNAVTIKKGGTSRSIPVAQISDIVQKAGSLSFRVASRQDVTIRGTTLPTAFLPDEIILYDMEDTEIAAKMARFLSGNK